MSLSSMITYCGFFLAFGSVCTGCKKSGVLLWPSSSFCTLPLFFSRTSDESFGYDFGEFLLSGSVHFEHVHHT